MGKEQKVKVRKHLLLLLLSIALFCYGWFLGKDELSIQYQKACIVWLPPVHEHRPSPAVVIAGYKPGLALELCRRGFVVIAPVSVSSTEQSIQLLSEIQQVDEHKFALVAIGKKAGAAILSCTMALHERNTPASALVLWGAEAEIDTQIKNSLVLFDEDREMTGYYGDGSARLWQKQTSGKKDMTAVISWLSNSLGHPRDGFFADDEFIAPYSLALQVVGLCGGAVAVTLLTPQKRKAKASSEKENSEDEQTNH